ncbi:MAG: hybrid sensor histidine kinase/response regulator [Planctomycetales bacterium]|nr:hybrid sensor histidine kinase/response regulator [Planctomycetales bacterium]
MAHDLNNALTPVLVFSDLLKNECDACCENANALEMIQAGAAHAGQVVKQLQYFYRDGSDGAAERANEPVNLLNIVNQAKELCRFRWHDEAVKRGVKFDIRVDVSDGSLVLGNETELVQLVNNLLFNAIDAMPDGGTIIVSTVHKDGLIELTVSDQGVGMSSDERDKCFEPFFSTKNTGTGLGLSVCYGIARRHGGNIRCQENSFGGCDFVVLLPSNLANFEGGRVAGKDFSNCNGKRILVIDDDQIVLTSMSAMLKSLGCSVDLAHDGLSGISLAKEKDYDLVITDLGMPGITGRDVVCDLKQHRPDLRIAVASGWSGHAVATEFQSDSSKPDFFIEKPIVAAALNTLLSELSGDTESAAQASSKVG